MIALNIIALVTEGLDIEYNRIVDIIGEEVELRVVHSLFMLANKFGPNLQIEARRAGQLRRHHHGNRHPDSKQTQEKGHRQRFCRPGIHRISDLSRLQNYKKINNE